MSATIVIDMGMNDFERGRLLKNLSEFSTQRFLALSSLGSYRFFSDALDVLTARLSTAASDWLGGAVPSDPDMESAAQVEWRGYGSSYGSIVRDQWEKLRARWMRLRLSDEENIANARTREKDQAFIQALQDLTIDLTMLNSLIDGGIPAHSTAVQSSRKRVKSLISAIGHIDLPGFLSLTEFLDRRFSKSIHEIASIGMRYDLLRRRAAELSALVEAKVQIEQNRDQNTLLNKVDRLTLFGITYYAGQILAYVIVGKIVLSSSGAEIDLEDKLNNVKYHIYPILMILAIFIGVEVIWLLFKELIQSKISIIIAKAVGLIFTKKGGAVILALITCLVLWAYMATLK